jgi:hypothetical protein
MDCRRDSFAGEHRLKKRDEADGDLLGSRTGGPHRRRTRLLRPIAWA